MAVFQISRIQIRRGQASQGTGIPQLASGEMAWAIDTQQLYIGNGAVSEGSPAVGNTRILTSVDLTAAGNLLNLAEYVYKTTDTAITTGPDSNNPVIRTIQSRLDERATVRDFGALGSATLITASDINSGYTGTDDTAALQRAINELFLNSANLASANNGPADRVTLYIPAGVYLISSPIYIPSYTTLIGEGIDKTIIYYDPVISISGSILVTYTSLTTTGATAAMVGAAITGPGIPANTTITAVVPGVSVTISNAASATETNASFVVTISSPAFVFVNYTSTAGNPSVLSSTLYINQPRNIKMSGFTIHSPTGKNACMQMDAVRDSLFDEIKLQGDWTNAGTPNPACTGIVMNALSSLVTCQHNSFQNMWFNNFYYAVYAQGDILNNDFENCKVNDSRVGFSLGTGSNGVSVGQQYGPRHTYLNNCDFYDVKLYAAYIERGEYNTLANSRLVNVGNNGGGNVSAAYPQVYFATYNNSVLNNQSDRGNDLAVSNLTTPYLPEVGGHGRFNSYGTRSITMSNNSFAALLFRLPIPTDASGNPQGTIRYAIDYYYKSQANPGSSFSRSGTMIITADIDSKNIQFSDDYEFTGTDPTNSNALLLDFTANFLAQNGAAYTGAGGQYIAAIGVNYVNTLAGDTGYIEYSYSAVV